MSLQSTLKCCHDALRESAKVHRENNRPYLAHECDRQADAALHWMDDEACDHSPIRKETSDGPA